MTTWFANLKTDDVEAVRKKLDKGVDVNEKNMYGWTLLLIAIHRGLEGVTDLLLSRGACPNMRLPNRLTALSLTCSVTIARKLLAHGADPNVAGIIGWTPLMSMAIRKKHDVLRVLLEAGASVHAPSIGGKTALMVGSYSGNEEVVWLLLNYGSDVYAVSEEGMTALMYAEQHEDEDEDATEIRSLMLSFGRVPTGEVPLVRDQRRAVEESVRRAGDGDVAALCGEFVTIVDR